MLEQHVIENQALLEQSTKNKVLRTKYRGFVSQKIFLPRWIRIDYL